MPRSAPIDTNILVYVYDSNDVERQAKAIITPRKLRSARAGYLSVKTLSEFFVVVRRIPNPLTIEAALLEMKNFSLAFPVLDLTVEITLEAARGVKDYGFSYWDAQMWATARTHRLDALFSEDMNAGSIIENVSLVNPLAEDFNPDSWLEA